MSGRTDGENGPGRAEGCFWDAQTSGQAMSAGGTGKTTAEMQTARTFLEAGWDFVDENQNGTHEIWQMPPGGGYPALATFSGYAPPRLQGSGTAEDPYLISNALELRAMIYYSSFAHYRLAASINLSGIRWVMPVIPAFRGVLDGDGHTISRLTIAGAGYLGLFGRLESGAEIKNLGVVDVSITGDGGGLAASNGGTISHCYSTGSVSGDYYVGGLVGGNDGLVTRCYAAGAVSGKGSVGGLVGYNYEGTVTQCYSTGPVAGESNVGGLVGENCCCGRVAQCYSTGKVSGNDAVGGLAGRNGGEMSCCYSTGSVTGDADLGGLVGSGTSVNDMDEPVVGRATMCFWDTQTSGQATSAGGTGKTTAEMQTASTFLDAGWDFVGQADNGSEDIWWIDEGKDYPRLWWEAGDEASP